MTSKAWFPWVWIFLGYFLALEYYSGSYVNCRLDECSWFSPPKIFFGAIAIIFCFIWWRRTETKIWTTLLNASSFLAAFHLVLNGAGLIGPEGCPEIDPNCRFNF